MIYNLQCGNLALNNIKNVEIFNTAMGKSTGEIFVRKLNKWELEKTLSIDRFLEGNKIFCNMQNKCMKIVFWWVEKLPSFHPNNNAAFLSRQ